MTIKQAITKWLTDSLTTVLTELWKRALATFATKAEASANFATAAEAKTAAEELT